MLDHFRCPKCDWEGIIDEMESTYDEIYTGDDEIGFGSMCVCPSCKFEFGKYSPDQKYGFAMPWQ